MNREEMKAQAAENIKANQAIAQANATRFHKVFVQNPDGKKILEEWTNSFLFNGFVADDATLAEFAKAEARREFVCAIYSQIQQIEPPKKG
jgi:hypothetical protein